MDDAFTFFDAEPVEEYDSKIRGRKDIGWHLRSKLRILGTFPDRSGLKVKVKRNGRELSSVYCEGRKTKDFLDASYRCFDEKSVIKQTGKMNVDVYFVDGSSGAEKLVRTYLIDVHKATRVRGRPENPLPEVSHYYIQRHAEAAVAFAYFRDSNDRRSGYYTTPSTQFSNYHRTLYIHTTYSPASKGYPPSGAFARCTVNGQPIDFSGNLNRDNVRILEDQSRREVAIYTDRKAPKYKRGAAYMDQVEFMGFTFQMPIYTGQDNSSLDLVKIEENQGTWECKVMHKGTTYRTFRWEVVKGKVLPHPEQQSGNVNLFHDASIVDMEIPAGGSPLDYRLISMPGAGLFYGIPWESAEGKKMAARVPQKGRPYQVPSNRPN